MLDEILIESRSAQRMASCWRNCHDLVLIEILQLLPQMINGLDKDNIGISIDCRICLALGSIMLIISNVRKEIIVES